VECEQSFGSPVTRSTTGLTPDNCAQNPVILEEVHLIHRPWLLAPKEHPFTLSSAFERRLELAHFVGRHLPALKARDTEAARVWDLRFDEGLDVSAIKDRLCLSQFRVVKALRRARQHFIDAIPDNQLSELRDAMALRLRELQGRLQQK